jgi:2Fe-2S ferredoxin
VPLVSFQPSGRAIEVPAGSTLLEAALAAGLPIARACGADGLCARCALRILAGAGTGVDAAGPDEAAVRERNRLDPALRLACRAHVTGDVEVTASYW